MSQPKPRPLSEKDHECPQCGTVVPAGRTVCRECGSDYRTGWQSNDDIDYHATGLVTEEKLPSAPPEPVSKKMILLAIVVGILALVFGKQR